MFGYNVGALMSYMKTASLLQRGAQVYASRKARFIDIIQTEDFPDKTSFIGTDEVTVDGYTDVDQTLMKADAYLDAVGDTPKVAVIPIKSVDTYDFASLYGLTGATPEVTTVEEPSYPQAEKPPMDLFESEPDPVIIEEPIKPVVAAPEPVRQPTVTTPQPVKPVQQTTSTPSMSVVPEVTGMNLKTQAQTIAKWYAKPIMQESVLFEAFGKSVIMKLVGEGYLVRTKKGILLGS